MTIEQKPNFSISTPALYILSAILFFLYFAIAQAHHFFPLPHLHYNYYFHTIMDGIPSQWINSQFWKILLLFPATVLLSIAFSRSRYRFSIHKHIDKRYSIFAILIGTLIIISILIHYVFCNTLMIDDEYVFDFEAKTLISGNIINPPPPSQNNFYNQHIINDGRVWAGRYPLGHPAIIALGMLLGNRYIITVAISILTLFLIYLITFELYNDKKTAFLALCCAAISPFFYFVSSSLLSNITTTFFLAVCMYFFLRFRHTDKTLNRILFAFISGLSLGYAFNVRPLTALGYSLVFCLVAIWDITLKRYKPLISFFIFSAGFAILFFLTLMYNKLVTGGYLNFVHTYYSIITYGQPDQVGFGTYGHTPLHALVNLSISIARMNSALLGFPISLIFIFLVCFFKNSFGDRLLWGIIIGFVFAYCFWFTPGVSDIGPVYYYELIIPLCILTARGILFLHKWLSDHVSWGATFTQNFVILSIVFAFLTYVPEKVHHITTYTRQVREPYELVQTSGIHHAVVMIKTLPMKGFIWGFRNPSPTFTDDVIYCRYADKASNLKLADYFKDRALFTLDYNPKNDHYTLKSISRDEL